MDLSGLIRTLKRQLRELEAAIVKLRDLAEQEMAARYHAHHANVLARRGRIRFRVMPTGVEASKGRNGPCSSNRSPL